MRKLISISVLSLLPSLLYAAHPTIKNPATPIEVQHDIDDLDDGILNLKKNTNLARVGVSTTSGFNTDAAHTKDWPTQIWCLSPQFILCVDTAPLPYGQRVMIGSATSVRHAGLEVNYSLAFKPTLMTDTKGVFGNSWSLRSETNSLFLVSVDGWWQGTAVDTSTIIMGAYQGPIYFYTKNSTIPILKLGNSSNENIEFRNGSTVSFEIDSSSIAANLTFYAKGNTSGATVPQGDQGETPSTSTLSNVNVGTTNQYFDIVSTGISAGHWMIGANVTYTVNSAAFTNSQADFELGINQTAGNSTVGLVLGDNYTVSVASANAGGYVTLPIVNYELNINAPTTIYLKGFAGNYTSGRPQVRGRMTPIRLP